jgi:beta-glucosidase
VDSYTDEMISNAKEFSDNAIVVLTRTGGEHIDLPRAVSTVTYTNNSEDYKDFPAGTTYLELSQTEKNLMEMVCENFQNVVVVLNSANTMEMGWVSDYANVKSVIWCPGTGQNGFNALGEILIGSINPSAKAADTFVADLQATPTWNTFAEYTYDNMEEYQVSESDPYMPGNLAHFINYSEGIYVGYKFYETAAAERFPLMQRTWLPTIPTVQAAMCLRRAITRSRSRAMRTIRLIRRPIT